MSKWVEMHQFSVCWQKLWTQLKLTVTIKRQKWCWRERWDRKRIGIGIEGNSNRKKTTHFILQPSVLSFYYPHWQSQGKRWGSTWKRKHGLQSSRPSIIKKYRRIGLKWRGNKLLAHSYDGVIYNLLTRIRWFWVLI